LTASIQQLIRERGPLPFPEFMALALYEPGKGYYARGTRQVGRGGDFFTSVSVGPLFGRLLARRLTAEWHKLGQPGRWRITECGAHDGRLARDILDTLAEFEPAAHSSLEYAISEPLGSLREAQCKTLHPHLDRVRQVENPQQLKPLPGVIFGNEVLDALPCHLVEWHGDRWQHAMVTLDDSAEFRLTWADIDSPELKSILGRIGSGFPAGYRSEVRTNYAGFMQPLAASLERGTMIWIDYGFERADYYHPDRHQGTLRTFDHHQSGDNPLLTPGEIDISAHVDFTAVAEAAESLGGRPAPLVDQGGWLTHIARDWLLQQEGRPDAKALRQFQTLTHPGHLGRAFQVLEIEWPPRQS